MTDFVQKAIEQIKKNNKSYKTTIKRCEDTIVGLERELVSEYSKIETNLTLTVNKRIEIARLETVCNCNEDKIIESDILLEILENKNRVI